MLSANGFRSTHEGTSTLPVKRLHRRARRQPALAAAGAFTLVLLLVSLVGLSLMLARERRLRGVADMRREEAQRVVDTMLSRYVVQLTTANESATPEQENLLREALTFYERLSDESPDDDDVRQKIAECLHLQSDVQEQRLDRQGAIATREKGLSILHGLVARHPDNDAYRYDLFFNAYRLAILYSSPSEWDAGARCLDLAERTIEELLEGDPGNFTYRDAQVALGFARISSLWERGEFEPLSALISKYELRSRDLLEQYPDNASQMTHLSSLLEIREQLAQMDRRRSEDEAYDLFAQSKESLNRVLETAPPNWLNQRLLRHWAERCPFAELFIVGD